MVISMGTDGPIENDTDSKGDLRKNSYSIYLSSPKPGTRLPESIKDYSQRQKGKKDPLQNPQPSTENRDTEYCIIAVEFSDTTHDQSVSAIEGMILTDSNSMKSYYEENSYGDYVIGGSTASGQWLQTGDSMSEYGADSQSGEIDMGNGHPNRLASKGLELADGQGVDFSIYDDNNDEIVDHLIIVHAGEGQETDPQNTNLIWSHYSGVYETSDGVQFNDYSVVSEFGPVGVVAHECGHDLGLIDLYDIDYSSDGIGVWGLMGAGAWYDSPSHFCGYNKIELGWANPQIIEEFLLEDTTLRGWAAYPDLYKLPISDTEYFLIENRHKNSGIYDSQLPGSGLLITHIDEEQSDNTNDQQRRVDVEEADGNGELDVEGGPSGEATDLWKNTEEGFNDESNPSSKSYDNTPTNWRAYEIGNAEAEIIFNIAKAVEIDAQIENIRLNTTRFVRIGDSGDTQGGDYNNTCISAEIDVTQAGALNLSDLTFSLRIYQHNISEKNIIYAINHSILQLQSRTTQTINFNQITLNKTQKYIMQAKIIAKEDQVPENNERYKCFWGVASYDGFFWNFENSINLEEGKWNFEYQRNTNILSPNNPYNAYKWEIRNKSNQPDINPETMPTPENAWHIGRHPEEESWISVIRNLEGYNASMTLKHPISVNPSSTNEGYLIFYAKYVLQEVTEHGNPQGPSNKLKVQISTDGTNWNTLKLFEGNDKRWRNYILNVSEYIGEEIYIKFRAEHLKSVPEGGFFFDSLSMVDSPIISDLHAKTPFKNNMIPISINSTKNICLKMVNLGSSLTNYQVGIIRSDQNDDITTQISENNPKIEPDRLFNNFLIINVSASTEIQTKLVVKLNISWIDKLSNEQFSKLISINLTVVENPEDINRGLNTTLYILLGIGGVFGIIGIIYYINSRHKQSNESP